MYVGGGNLRKNLLVTKEAEEMLEKYKEEIAHEFGIFHTVTDFDRAETMTKKLLNKTREQKKGEC